jgi:hypothetical protein
LPYLADELLFFNHSAPERIDLLSISFENDFEARMIIEFVIYLQKIGVARENVTVLTFYSQ